MGSVNAAVLPLPVCASPMTSRPDRASGSASAWMGVGLVKLSRVHASTSSGHTPASAKVAGGGGAAAAPAAAAGVGGVALGVAGGS